MHHLSHRHLLPFFKLNQLAPIEVSRAREAAVASEPRGAGQRAGGMAVPRELLQIVGAARPQCTFWLKGWCKKGGGCTQRHSKADDQANAQLPHISRHDGPSGTRITLRPPLQPAIQQFFRASGKPCTLGGWGGRTF